MRTIHNPVLKGFNPDPSILRVGDDYFIATSTFQWFPGVQIHHSRDLVNWRLLTHPLSRLSQLNMAGDPNSGGIWAPCLSYADGIFYLVFTDVKCLAAPFIETHNYLVTSNDIEGEWSEPVYLNSTGFDPSLFHDTDGRKWILNMVWDYRKGGADVFYGIELTEYDPGQKKLIGNPEIIFKGAIGVTEGPHLYKLNGFYYLITAEGGTGSSHAVTVCRSKSIHGPYEVHPQNPMLTTKGKLENPFQNAGHASFVNTPDGEWYLAHLCTRRFGGNKSGFLGRETALQKFEWNKENWPVLSHGNNDPQETVPAPNIESHPFPAEGQKDDFDKTDLSVHYQTLRVPLTDRDMSLTERPGYLRLKGGAPLSSWHKQSLVGRRVKHFSFDAVTAIEFEPDSIWQMAGLVVYYDTLNHYYLRIRLNENGKKSIGIHVCNLGEHEDITGDEMILENKSKVYLKAEMRFPVLKFAFSYNESDWKYLNSELDAQILTDQHADWGFTGTFICLACQGKTGRRVHADFDFLEYLVK